MRYIILLVFISASLAGCSKDPEPSPDMSGENNPVVDVDMRAGEPEPDMKIDEQRDMPPEGEADMKPALEVPNELGGNPMVPEFALLPFPSNFYLAKDDSTRTGYSIEIPQDALVRQTRTEMFSGIDGFSRIPLIITYLPGGVQVSSLPDPLDPGASLEDDASVFLIDSETMERIPALVEVDARADSDDERALIVRALRGLEANTNYVVIVTNKVLDAQGSPHTPNAAYVALRDGTPTATAALEAQRADFEVVARTIEANGTPAGDVVQAWSFRTRSEEAVVEPTLAMQRAASEFELGDVTVTSEELIDDGAVKLISGKIDAPNFVSSTSKVIEYDDAGMPIQQGMREVEFLVSIPTNITSPRPVIVFGHGFFSKQEEITYSSYRELTKERGYISIATNFEGFDEGSSAKTITMLSSKIGDIDQLVSQQLQAYTHFSVLARVARDKLPALLVDDGGESLVDTEQVHYMGISNGATFGAVIASTSLEFTRAALVVGGGGLVHFLERAESWNALGALITRRYDTQIAVQQLLMLLQLKLDPIDSVNYVAHLTEDRFDGLPELEASWHMAVNDSSVHNLVTEFTARTAKVPLVMPSSKVIWGLEQVDASTDRIDRKSALVVYDEMLEPSPITNESPAEDNGGHASIRNIPAYREHIARFIEGGDLIQVCDGACDPE